MNQKANSLDPDQTALFALAIKVYLCRKGLMAKSLTQDHPAHSCCLSDTYSEQPYLANFSIGFLIRIIA
jgi:hypothetical protein